jgi:flagellar protein FlaJ
MSSQRGVRDRYFGISLRLFKRVFKDEGSAFLDNVQLELDRAEITISSEAYVSGVLFASLIAGILFTLLTALSYFSSLHSLLVAVSIPISVLVVTGTGFAYPRTKSSRRGKEIDGNLGSAFAFISAMASADVPINTIMIKLSKMKEYGTVSEEATKIANRTEFLGMDVFTAMQEVAKTSPSIEWQKFLQGAVATSTAGARLKPYFVNRVTDYQNRLRVSLRKNAESVSVFAETYVTIGVALPLFLIVILAVMSVVASNASGTTISFLMFFSFLVLPVIIIVFVLLISSVNKEVRIS